MVAVDRMQLGRFEFAIEFATFRYITQSWSGPGLDFNFSGRCLNGNSPAVSRAGTGQSLTAELHADRLPRAGAARDTRRRAPAERPAPVPLGAVRRLVVAVQCPVDGPGRPRRRRRAGSGGDRA